MAIAYALGLLALPGFFLVLWGIRSISKVELTPDEPFGYR